MPRILVADKLESPGLELLRDAGFDLEQPEKPLKDAALREALQRCEGVIVRSATKLTAAELAEPGKLKVIVRAGVGVDTIDVDAATRKGILVMNTPSGNTISTAEQTVALLMSLARHTAAADASMKAGKWERAKFMGTQLAGKTLGVIGLGRIGQEVARRCAGMDMKIVGYDPFMTPARASALGIETVPDVKTLLPRCDFLTVHTPLSDETRNLVDAAGIASMPKGARIVNCARGGIINEDALVEALTSGHLAGAALDVFVEEPVPATHPVLKLPNVVLTPHLGASTVEAQVSVAKEAAQLLIDYLGRGVVGFAVNMPAVDRAELDEMRLYVDMARRLGMMLAQMATGTIQKAEIQYRGDVARKSTRLVTSAFTAGLLEGRLDQPVNIVNAPMLAAERGIEVLQQANTTKGDFSTVVRVDLHTTTRTFTAAGTLFGNQYLRIVQLGDFYLDAYMDGHLLLFYHRDVPGLIGFIGTIFGKHGVNIAQMTVGRRQPGGEAIAVLNLDSHPPEEALREMRAHAQISNVTLVKLPPAGQMPPWFG